MSEAAATRALAAGMTATAVLALAAAGGAAQLAPAPLRGLLRLGGVLRALVPG